MATNRMSEQPKKKRDTGWVSIHRSLQEQPYYTKSEYVHLWIHLLLSANYKDNEVMIGNQIVKVKRGQLLTGRVALSRQIGEQQNKVERILKVFEKAHQIEQQTTNKYRLITIVNYDLYQNNEQQFEQQMNNKRTTDEQQMNTNNKVNKVNKVNKEYQRSPLEIFAEEIFIHWNKQNIIIHKSLSKEARAEIRRVFKEGYDVRDVKGMITLYATILKGEEFFWSYKWNLYEFLKRGLKKFEGKTVDDYRKDKEETLRVIDLS